MIAWPVTLHTHERPRRFLLTDRPRPRRKRQRPVRAAPRKGGASIGRAQEVRCPARRVAAPPRSADRAPAPDSGPVRLPLGAAPGRARLRDEDGDGRGLRSGHVLSPLRCREGRRCRAARDHRARVRFDRVRSRRGARAAGGAARATRKRRARPARARASGAARRRPSRSSDRIRSRTQPRTRWRRSCRLGR